MSPCDQRCQCLRERATVNIAIACQEVENSLEMRQNLRVLIRMAFLLVLCTWSVVAATNGVMTVLTVAGAGGDDEYQKQFVEWAGNWEKAARQADAEWIGVGTEPGGTNDLAALTNAFDRIPKDGLEPLWIVLLGHGTFDGKEAKFNLRGPDFSTIELGKWLDPYRRPLVIINAASSSAPFLNALSRSNRVIVTATRSGHEQNFARLGKYLSQTIADTGADLDKDGQTSLLEAFLSASRQTTDWYKSEGRLATEHALLDDNGDGFGTQADWFRGVRAVKKPEKGSAVDGLRAHQIHLLRHEGERRLPTEVRARRDEIELSIFRLREAKAKMKEDEYYRQLEPLLLEMARLYEDATR
jgi:hypothetical protein